LLWPVPIHNGVAAAGGGVQAPDGVEETDEVLLLVEVACFHHLNNIAVAAPQAPNGVEETDELLLWDEEMADVDPECLPKRLITDFSIYNGEVRDAKAAAG
jgi:hypothetical protein